VEVRARQPVAHVVEAPEASPRDGSTLHRPPERRQTAPQRKGASIERRACPKLRAFRPGPIDESALSHDLSPTGPNRHLIAPPDDLVARGVPYLDFFRFLDRQLAPRSYFEIGTATGASLGCFSCDAVCVDPAFTLEGDALGARSATHLFRMTSDAFFRRHDLRRLFPDGPDISFLDGMHRSEFLLRDFINTERACHRRSLVFLHDCLPANARMTGRAYEQGDESEGPWRLAWTGDVWKMIPLLAKHRPDLTLLILDCGPTGLVAISGLDPSSTVLAEAYPSLLEELRALEFSSDMRAGLWTGAPILSSRSLLDAPEDLTLFLDIR
jgi:hypothetical protein